MHKVDVSCRYDQYSFTNYIYRRSAGSDQNVNVGSPIALDATVTGNVTDDLYTEAQFNYGSTVLLADPNWSASGSGWKGESNETWSSNTGPSQPQSTYI